MGMGGGVNFVGVNGSVFFCRSSIRSMLITSWLMILEVQNRMCGSPDVSCIDHLGAVSVATVLVFRACSCGTASIIAMCSMLLITCGAASWVCMLAWSGGVILGRVTFGNTPGVLCRVVHWWVRAFACRIRLEVGLLAHVAGGAALTLWIAGHFSWSMLASTLYYSSSTLCFGTRRQGGLPEIYASRCGARVLGLWESWLCVQW